MNVPIGLLGSFSPTRFLRIAFTILSTALSCPMIAWRKVSPMCNNLVLSALAIRCTGTPDIIATTSAIFSSSTISRCSWSSSSHFCLAVSS